MPTSSDPDETPTSRGLKASRRQVVSGGIVAGFASLIAENPLGNPTGTTAAAAEPDLSSLALAQVPQVNLTSTWPPSLHSLPRAATALYARNGRNYGLCNLFSTTRSGGKQFCLFLSQDEKHYICPS